MTDYFHLITQKPRLDPFALAQLREEAASGFAAGYIRRKAREIVRYTAAWLADIDDLRQQLMLQLFERLPDFDETRGCFNAFVKMVVDGAAANLQRDLVRRCEERRGECSLSLLVEGCEGVPEPLASTIGDREGDARRGRHSRSACDAMELSHDVELVVRSFPRREEKILRRLMDRSPTQTAHDLHHSRATIYALLRRARTRLLEAGFTAPRGIFLKALRGLPVDYPNRGTSRPTCRGERRGTQGSRSHAECASRR